MTTEAIMNEISSHEDIGIWKECSNCGWRGTVETNRKQLCPECGDKGTMSPTELHIKADGTPLTVVAKVTRTSRTKLYADGYNEVEKYFIFSVDDEGVEHKASVLVEEIIKNFEHREYRELPGATFQKPFSGDRIRYMTWNEKNGWGAALSLQVLESTGKDGWIAEQKTQEKTICQGKCGKCTMRVSKAGNEYLYCDEMHEPVFKVKKCCDVYRHVIKEAKLAEGRKNPVAILHYAEVHGVPRVLGASKDAVDDRIAEYFERDAEAHAAAFEDGYTVKTAPVVGGRMGKMVWYVVTWDGSATGGEWTGEFYANEGMANYVKNQAKKNGAESAWVLQLEVV